MFRPVNDQAVGFGNDLSDFPLAVFSTGGAGMPFRVYAQSGAHPAPSRLTPLPGVSLNAPHRFRIEWNPTNVLFYVDGALVATHTVTIDRGHAAGGQRLRPLRRRRAGPLAASGRLRRQRHVQLAHARRRPRQRPLADAHRARPRCPAAPSSPSTPARAPPPSPTASWSAWQPVGAGGAIASPAARYIQYRARMASTTGVASPTLNRVQI